MNNWHSLDLKDIYEKLKTNINGLNDKEVNSRLNKYGLNVLPQKKPHTFIQIFLLQFKHPIIILLIFATIASLSIGEYIDASFIMLVVLLNSFLGAFQENKAEKSAFSLQTLIKHNTVVLRNKKEIVVDSSNLVPGDIVLLESGEKVPADMRIIKSNNLTLDESFLTGESIALEKKECKVEKLKQINEQKNMCFGGSTVLTGRATCVVVETGESTEVGKIAKNLVTTSTAKTPLIMRMERFTKQITYFALFLCMLLSIILYFNNYVPREIFFFVVALSVSIIPEGLPVALTVALSVATSRMAKRNVIVRKLTAVESLGSCTVIASDKTGTLTVNQQTAKKIVLPDNKKYEISGEGYNDKGTIINDKLTDNIVELSKVSIITNEGVLEFDKEKWNYHGDFMDVALLSLNYKLKMNPSEIRKQNKIYKTIPYESENKYSAAYYKNDKKNEVAVKGAVETVLNFCSKMQIDKKTVDIDLKKIKTQAEELSKKGYRVLAFAKKEIKENEELNNLVFLGLIGFIDPLRTEVIDSIKKCRNAGIKVLMITGDHPLTALSIAKEMEITKDDTIVTGEMLEEINSEKELDKIVKKTNVFARITPFQKLQIVESLLRLGEFVAVTGDGVNDAPALKKANIGVAMGSGTDVAIETSEMIITDDNFSSIVSGIEEGRYAYANVRKVILLLISTGFAEVVLFLLAIIFNLPIPLLAVQILWLNLVTNGIQDVALAFEGGEPGVMNVDPRHPKEKVFNKLMLKQMITSGLTIGLISFALWFFLNKYNFDINISRNYLLLVIVLMQNIHSFNCRSERRSVFKIPLNKNKILIIGILAATSIHLISTRIPIMQTLLNINPVNLKEILLMFLLALPLLLVMELFKKKNKV